MLIQMHTDTLLMLISAFAAVIIAYVESRRREPTLHSYERYDQLSESMTTMRVTMARIEQCYRTYPSADFLCEFEYATRARLDKLEELSKKGESS